MPSLPAPVPPGTPPPPQYRSLRPSRIVETADQLTRRIGERFPNSSLMAVSKELRQVADEALSRTEIIRQPHYLIRGSVAALILLLVVILATIYPSVRLETEQNEEFYLFEHFIQSLEASLGSLVFLGAAIAFLLSVERRWKRERLLSALRELRALAHVVDMHQLTKDPQSLTQGRPTQSSPQRTMTTFELGRYLDYCTEMLSIIGKVAAIYVQEFPDHDAVEAADELTRLTTDLTRNIWQKIMIIDRAVEKA
ncbi:MAG TPA: hypothetical protein VFG20_08090 [Planctomycetaceae bacterium]|nr:hypothetical protein [Planctomycetaceae bacterium]